MNDQEIRSYLEGQVPPTKLSPHLIMRRIENKKKSRRDKLIFLLLSGLIFSLAALLFMLSPTVLVVLQGGLVVFSPMIIFYRLVRKEHY